jgi:hypothetical protein
MVNGAGAGCGRSAEEKKRNFHLFVEMSRLTLGVKTLRPRGPQGEMNDDVS